MFYILFEEIREYREKAYQCFFWEKNECFKKNLNTHIFLK